MTVSEKVTALLQRLRLLESLGIAFAITGALTFSYGFLETAGFPRLSMFTVWMVMGASWGAVNLVRAYGIAPEDALRAANAKFERRFRAMEAQAEGQLAELSLEEQETLWQRVKSTEAS